MTRTFPFTNNGFGAFAMGHPGERVSLIVGPHAHSTTLHMSVDEARVMAAALYAAAMHAEATLATGLGESVVHIDVRAAGVRDRETGQLLADADYDNEAMARAKCRLQAAAEIERLYILDRPTATARIVAIIGEQTDPQWAAELICDFFEGCKK